MSTEIAKVEQLQAEVAPVVARAAGVVVSTPEQYEDASGFLASIKGAQKRVKEWFVEPVGNAHKAWKALTQRRADVLAPLEEAERAVKRKLVDYAAEQERIRAAEQARLQAEADERARRKREAAEKAAAKLKTPELREQRLAEAATIAAPVVTVAADTPKVQGQSIRKVWRARVIDPHAAVEALLALPDWTTYIKVSQGELDRFAGRTKGAVKMAGIEWFEEAQMSSRGR
jgi:hypothetical protein